jgi:tetratricopeptide (TPR) repeat protein
MLGDALPSAKRSVSHRTWVSAASIVVVAMIAGLPSLRGGFLSGDDRELVLNAPLVSHPSLSHALELLTLKPHRDLYQPVPLLVFSGEFAIVRALGLGSPGEGAANAEGAAWFFHLTNLLIHAATALLVWRLICRLHEDRRVALVAALLFAVHPLAVEPIAWLNGRMMSLSALFCLAALNVFEDWDRRPRVWLAMLGILLVVLAMASKVQLGLPILMVLLRAAHARRPRGAWWGLVAACAAITVAFTLIDVHLTNRINVLATAAQTLQGSRVARTLLALGWYFQRFVLPVGLASFHPVGRLVTWSSAGVIPALVTVVLVGAAVGVSFRWTRVGAIGLAWFLATVAATLPLVPSRNVMVAERYVYLPNVGLCWAVAALAVFAYRRFGTTASSAGEALRLVPQASSLHLKQARIPAVRPGDRERVMQGLGILGLIGLTAMSWHVASFYRNDIANSSHIVALYPNTVGTWTQLAWDYHRAGQYREAIEAARHDLANNPQAAASRANQVIGMCQLQLGDAAGAVESLKTAVRADPTDARAYYRLGQVCERAGRLDEATAAYQRAIERRSDYSAAAVALGRLLCGAGEVSEGVKLYERVLADDPYDADAALALAEAEIASGRETAAAARLRRLLAWMPENWTAWTNLGVCLANSGRTEEAIAAYRKALAVNPQATTATINLIAVLARSGKAADADAALDRLSDGNADRAALWAAHDMLVSQGQLPLALRLWTNAMKREPKAADLEAAYAWTCALAMQWDAAKTHAAEVLKTGTEPAVAIARMTLAMVALAGGDPAPAVAWVNASPGANPPAYVDLHRCMRQALAAYGEVHMDDPWPYYLVARLLQVDGNGAVAAAAMQRFSELCGSGPCREQAQRLGVSVGPTSQPASAPVK